MTDLLSRLGLRTTTIPTAVPSYAAHFIIFNFVLSYAATSPRFTKTALGLDHNVAPREDIDKYGPEAVKSGKITQKQLDKLKRQQAAHENAVEHLPIFISSVVLASVAGLDNGMINRYSLAYTVVRALYAVAYVQIDNEKASFLRTVLWWAGNITVFRLFWFATKTMNAARGL